MFEWENLRKFTILQHEDDEEWRKNTHPASWDNRILSEQWQQSELKGNTRPVITRFEAD